MTQTEVIHLTPEPPRKPDEIPVFNFSNFEIITQVNIDQIVEAVEKGEREPLNHVALPYNDYLTLAAWMERIELYIKQAEVYFDLTEKRYDQLKTRGVEDGKTSQQTQTQTGTRPE